MEELLAQLKKMTEIVQKACLESDRLRRQTDTATAWVLAHGEIVTKTEAAEILRVSRSTLYELIDRGEIKTAPDGRVLVRSMAAWATGKQSAKKSKK